MIENISFEKKSFDKNKKLIRKCFNEYGVVIINNFFDKKKTNYYKITYEILN